MITRSVKGHNNALYMSTNRTGSLPWAGMCCSVVSYSIEIYVVLRVFPSASDFILFGDNIKLNMLPSDQLLMQLSFEDKDYLINLAY